MTPQGYLIRELELADAPALCAAYIRNKEHLAPWEPIRPASYYTPSGQEAIVRTRLDEQAAGRGASWVVAHGDDIVGHVSLSNIVRGVFQSCNLGYWTDHAHIGRGLATAAVQAACQAAADRGLHRVEAATLLENEASQAVLLKCGFTPIGAAPAYLFIAGRWQDHRLFQRTLHDEPPQ
jgi:ribosomal-protein-alanine N-acetyltransferase